MVYCGKASLGCSSCRKRRIKCDRAARGCSQCLRLNKVCPGYRNQLDLIFRDETDRTEKKVRASWAPEPPPLASSSRSRPRILTPPASDTSSPVSLCAVSLQARSVSPAGVPPLTPHRDGGSPPSALTMYTPVATRPTDLGIAFYADHYLVGYPDEPRSADDLGTKYWFQHSLAQDIMAATGLTALANLNDDKQLQRLSMEKYSDALVRTSVALKDPATTSMELDVTIRTVIMLALFQCVHLSHESHDSVRAHIMGCAALIKSAMPIHTAPAQGVRGVLQLCYSLFIPCIFSGIGLPSQFYALLDHSDVFLPPYEQPGTDLITIIAEVTELNATIRTTTFTDGRPATADVIRKMLGIDAALNHWETRQDGKWLYTVFRDESGSMSRDAIFKGRYHHYSDVWTSRIWSHYRWARILVSQIILDFIEQYPSSSRQLISTSMTSQVYDTITRMATDILTSAASHYKHPKLKQEQLDTIQPQGGAGIGIVGIPAMIFHLQVAACAPGVSYDIWAWALNILETVWAELGMLHARTLADVLRNHRERLNKQDADRSLKREEGDEKDYMVLAGPRSLLL